MPLASLLLQPACCVAAARCPGLPLGCPCWSPPRSLTAAPGLSCEAASFSFSTDPAGAVLALLMTMASAILRQPTRGTSVQGVGVLRSEARALIEHSARSAACPGAKSSWPPPRLPEADVAGVEALLMAHSMRVGDADEQVGLEEGCVIVAACAVRSDVCVCV